MTPVSQAVFTPTLGMTIITGPAETRAPFE